MIPQVNPTAGNGPAQQTNTPVAPKSWSGRRIAMAVIGALAAVATTIGGIFLAIKLSKKEIKGTEEKQIELGDQKITDKPPGDTPKKIVQINKKEMPITNNDKQYAKLLQRIEDKKVSDAENQIKNDEAIARSLEINIPETKIDDSKNIKSIHVEVKKENLNIPVIKSKVESKPIIRASTHAHKRVNKTVVPQTNCVAKQVIKNTH